MRMFWVFWAGLSVVELIVAFTFGVRWTAILAVLSLCGSIILAYDSYLKENS